MQALKFDGHNFQEVRGYEGWTRVLSFIQKLVVFISQATLAPIHIMNSQNFHTKKDVNKFHIGRMSFSSLFMLLKFIDYYCSFTTCVFSYIGQCSFELVSYVFLRLFVPFAEHCILPIMLLDCISCPSSHPCVFLWEKVYEMKMVAVNVHLGQVEGFSPVLICFES